MSIGLFCRPTMEQRRELHGPKQRRTAHGPIAVAPEELLRSICVPCETWQTLRVP
jgi:hypothetical protein